MTFLRRSSLQLLLPWSHTVCMLPAVAKSAPRSAQKYRRQKPNGFCNRLICRCLLYETPIYGPNNKQKSFVADRRANSPWLKGRHVTKIESPKVICRAVHDATFNNTTENSIIRSCCCTSLLQIQIVKEHPLKLRASGYCQIKTILRIALI